MITQGVNLDKIWAGKSDFDSDHIRIAPEQVPELLKFIAEYQTTKLNDSEKFSAAVGTYQGLNVGAIVFREGRAYDNELIGMLSAEDVDLEGILSFFNEHYKPEREVKVSDIDMLNTHSLSEAIVYLHDTKTNILNTYGLAVRPDGSIAETNVFTADWQGGELVSALVYQLRKQKNPDWEIPSYGSCDEMVQPYFYFGSGEIVGDRWGHFKKPKDEEKASLAVEVFNYLKPKLEI